MRQYVWIAICAGLLFFTILVPYWAAVLFYAAFFWLACPSDNFLSMSCGDITFPFVLVRIVQVAFIAALAHALLRLITRK